MHNYAEVSQFIRLYTSYPKHFRDNINLQGIDIWQNILVLIKPLTVSIPHYIETSLLICIANQLVGFYMMGNNCR